MNITYTSKGIQIDDTFINLDEITKQCTIKKIKEENLCLLTIKWSGFRGKICENVIYPIKNAEIIRNILIGKTINFGEVVGTIKEKEININTNVDDVLYFMIKYPSGFPCEYSFIETFYYNMEDDENVSLTECSKFKKAIEQ